VGNNETMGEVFHSNEILPELIRREGEQENLLFVSEGE
jgi:hypothetical protein